MPAGSACAVHNTLLFTVHDTLLFTVHNTLLFTVHDTLLFTVHDILLFTVHNTLLSTVHDTLLVAGHNTLLLTVHNTLLFTVHNTLLSTVHDTLLVAVAAASEALGCRLGSAPIMIAEKHKLLPLFLLCCVRCRLTAVPLNPSRHCPCYLPPPPPLALMQTLIGRGWLALQLKPVDKHFSYFHCSY